MWHCKETCITITGISCGENHSALYAKSKDTFGLNMGTSEYAKKDSKDCELEEHRCQRLNS